jgi:hypothetical protein
MRRLSLGRYGDVSLEEARARAAELTGAARKGVDLIGQEVEAREYVALNPRRADRHAGSFSQCADRLLGGLRD